MPPKTRKKLTKPLSSKYHPVQLKRSRKARIPKQAFVVVEGKEETKHPIPLIPIPNVRRNTCEIKYKEYELGGSIGSGDFGSVYKLCDAEENCPYVVKIIKLSSNPGDIKDFAREVAMQQYVYEKLQLAPRVYDAWICEPDSIDSLEFVFDALPTRVGFIIMERMDGSLNNYMYRHPYTETARQAIEEILISHVNKLHQLGVEHGDIKPANILYKTTAKDVKFVFGDFGLAHERSIPLSTAFKDGDRLSEEVLPQLIRRWPSIGLERGSPFTRLS